MSQNNPLVILGSGYTGKSLHQLAAARGMTVKASSRTPDRHLQYVPAADRIEFDLRRPETWDHIPHGSDLIWCFPAAPIKQVQAFARAIGPRIRRLLILGSTSAYDLDRLNPSPTAPLLDESSPIDLSLPRVQGEEYLRQTYRAIVLRVAGIYGPGRNPLDWIRQGRVTPSSRYVNLIHVEDLAAICLLTLESGRPGEIYNVSDGTPRRWIDICEEVTRRWGVSCPLSAGDGRSGKRISTAKLQNDLGYTFRHPDLYDALAGVECRLSN